jgi:hypothetical protein
LTKALTSGIINTTKGKEATTMAIIVKRNEDKQNKIKISEMDYSLEWNMEAPDGEKVNKVVESFYLVNDAFPNCRAHEKALTANEMIAIYEYMKKIMKGA